jgi:hypothetical protein
MIAVFAGIFVAIVLGGWIAVNASKDKGQRKD